MERATAKCTVSIDCDVRYAASEEGRAAGNGRKFSIGGPPSLTLRVSYGETDFACQELAVTWGGEAALDEARPKASEVWLGGRDSNPDKQSQSLLSYR
jgi:hypothetical protein